VESSYCEGLLSTCLLKISYSEGWLSIGLWKIFEGLLSIGLWKISYSEGLLSIDLWKISYSEGLLSIGL
jgi:hypothetical protein